MADDHEDDGKIGYCNPPKHSRYKKGQSGNPKGRPKKNKTEALDIPGVLDEPITVTQAGAVKKMDPFEASTRQIVKKALDENNLSATLAFLKLCEKYDLIKPPNVDSGGGVVFAPKGVNLHEWLDENTELVPKHSARE